MFVKDVDLEAIPASIFLNDDDDDDDVDGFLSLFSQHYDYRNVGLSSSKSRKFQIFGKKISP